MKAHVDFIVGKLKEQVLTADETSGIVTIVRCRRQHDVDAAEKDSRYSGSDHLDHFLFLLKMRMFSRRTARTMWTTDDYNDPTKTPEERRKIALDRAAEILGSVLGTIGKVQPGAGGGPGGSSRRLTPSDRRLTRQIRPWRIA
jgi:hypothetical protein